MLQDGLILADGSAAVNLQIDHGTSLPASGNNIGELFYLTSGTEGLYIYDGSSWVATGGDPTLPNVGTAGTFGSASLIPIITTDAQGRVTSVTTATVNSFDSASNSIISGNWQFNNAVQVGTPTLDSHATTKSYVDSVAAGLDPKASVRLATTANVGLTGATTVDGVAVVTGDRVLVKNQTIGSQNGIYIASTTGAWTRSPDFDGTPAAEVSSGAFTFITEGTTQGDTGWVLTTNDPITIGTTAQAWAQFSASGSTASATNIAGGSAGQVPYQSAASTTLFIANGTSGQVLTSQGNAAPTWTTVGTFNGGTITSALTIQGGLPQLTLGDTSNGGRIITAVSAAGAGQALQLLGANATVAGQNGGNVQINGGAQNGGGIGGTVVLNAGQSGAAASTGSADSISISGSFNNSTGVGGTIAVKAGASTTGVGGSIYFTTAATTTDTERLRILNNGAWSVGTGGTATGTSGQVLTSNGNASAPTWQAASAATPTLTSTQLAFGSAGNLQTSSANFTVDDANRIFYLGQIGGNNQTQEGITAQIRTRNQTGAVYATSLLVKPGVSNSVASGAVLRLSGGDGTSGSAGGGGPVIITGGLTNSGNTAGDIQISAGVAFTGSSATGSGNIIFSTGPGTALVERFRILNNGAWSVGTGGAAYGTATHVLTSNGNAPPTWQAVSAPSSFGNLVTFGDGTATAIIQSSTVGTTPASASLTIRARAPTNNNVGGALTLLAGDGTTASGGGAVIITSGGGAGASPAGNITIAGGVQGNSSTQQVTTVRGSDGGANYGGNAIFRGGDGGGFGGSLTLRGGNAPVTGNTGVSGAVTITGGSGGTNPFDSGMAGSVTISGGALTTMNAQAVSQTPGSVILQSGLAASATGPVTPGYIAIQTGTTTLTERLRITGAGAWNLAGVAATAGQVLTTVTAGGPPTWQTPTAGTATTLANTTTIGDGTGAATLQGALVTGATLLIRGSTNTGAGGNGGTVNILGGVPTDGAGGNVALTGTAAAGTNRGGGNAQVTGGTSTGTATAGLVTLTAGGANGTGAGGSISINGGYATGGAAGAVTISGGSSTGGTGGALIFQTAASNTLLERLRITNAGVVQPGADGAQTLGTSALRWATLFASTISDGATGTGMLIDSASTTVRHAVGSAWTTQTFHIGGTERMRIVSTGVNITDGLTVGTFVSTPPSNTVTGIVGAGSPGDTYTFDSNKTINHYGLTWKNLSDVSGGPSSILSAYGSQRFHTLGVERMRIGGDGVVTIGTSTQTATRVTMDGAAGGRPGMTMKSAGTTIWDTVLKGDAGQNYYMISNPAETVGVYMTTTASGWNNLSDERFKENLTPITNAVDKVNTLRAVRFTWTDAPALPADVGVIAQDVLAVLPEAVDTSNPDKYGVRYSALIPLLIASIKELSATNAALLARIEALEAA